MSIDFEDRTGMSVPVTDYDEAITAVRKFAVTGLLLLPPELAVQLPNILRCLEQGRALTAVTEEIRKAKAP